MQRLAIVGAGRAANVHASAYSKMPNVKVVGVMDVRPDAAHQLASGFGGEVFGDFDEMLRAVNPDVIDICTPTPWRKDYVLKSAEAGKHIITEKPLGRTLHDCQEMIDAANKAKVKLMVGHVLRFFPEFVMGKRQVEGGAVGSPALVRTTRGGKFPLGWNDWYANPDLSGGVALDLLVHDFDWLRWTFGEVERVYAKGLANRNVERMDYALVTLRFKSGVIGHVEGTWANPGGFLVTYEVAGDKGLLTFNSKGSMSFAVTQGVTDAKSPGVEVPESPTMQDPYLIESRHFIECIENGTDPLVTAEDAMKAVEISLAALESIRAGKPVKVGG